MIDDDRAPPIPLPPHRNRERRGGRFVVDEAERLPGLFPPERHGVAVDECEVRLAVLLVVAVVGDVRLEVPADRAVEAVGGEAFPRGDVAPLPPQTLVGALGDEDGLGGILDARQLVGGVEGGQQDRDQQGDDADDDQQLDEREGAGTR